MLSHPLRVRSVCLASLLEHDPEKAGTGFPKRSCSNKKIERDDDSTKSHPAPGPEQIEKKFFGLPGSKQKTKSPLGQRAFVKLCHFYIQNLERAKGFEPSTPTLARSCSTPELHPHPRDWRRAIADNGQSYAKCGPRMQQPRAAGKIGRIA